MEPDMDPVLIPESEGSGKVTLDVVRGPLESAFAKTRAGGKS